MIELNESNFSSSIDDNDTIVVDFFTSWCGPCKAFAPTFKSWSEKYADKACFAKMNVDDAMETSAKYRIHAIPTVVVFKSGKETARWQGMPGEKEIAEAIS